MNIKLFFILLSSFIVSFNSFAEIAVIVNPANKTVISDDDITRLFLGKIKSYSDGVKAVPINLKASNSTRGEFDKKVLNKNSSQVKAYWSKQMFSGKGRPPKEVNSDAEAISEVTKNPNSIAYIDAKNVNDSVRVLKKF